jgi:hypothetical protein
MFPTFFDKIPLRSYTRKMFGYLYAIKNNYNVIYDTDDDNYYKYDLNSFENNSKEIKTILEDGFVNLYKCYTDELIWPRGIPPDNERIYLTPTLSNNLPELECAVIQGLVDNDPDVDAHYRININNGSFNFNQSITHDIILDKYSICPFNTQNTFWKDPSMFYAMYLPVTVTFRYTDILRGFVALYQLWKNNKTIKFTAPTAIQERNEHDLNKDYESEIPMYKTASMVIELLNNNKDASIKDVYSIFVKNNIVAKNELEVLDEWLALTTI